jgi:NTE family protein
MPRGVCSICRIASSNAARKAGVLPVALKTILESPVGRLKVGLALSGGTAKSVAHVGVLKALVEEGIPIDCIAGTSGGSIVGALFASGMPVSTLENTAIHMSWRKLVSIRLSRLGFVSSGAIEEFVREMIGDVTFADLKTPLTVVAANLVTGEKREFTEGSVPLAVRASCSIPQIYLPVEIDGEYYVDGGLSEYLPVETLLDMGCEFCIASHLGPHDPAYRRPHHILQLVMQVTGLMARKNYVGSIKKADVLIHPNLDRFSSFDFNSSDKIIEMGYNATMAQLGDLRSKLARKSLPWARLWHKLRG